ncbi:hypothetical protein DSO57_1017384 [Entomophthora muscae]|uniref:Uncharacterized protein n=1 Tax=Entomophthora muscae TaxID=34485 RepID=A0ACC2U374_9FUNG|nr:hypothetical protein DSO57_1017384 [Entomophthora muscae]
MYVSFTPEEVFASALKKYQDKNGPTLPIPALVNHNSEEKCTTQKPTTKIELGLSAKEILANTKIEKQRTQEVMLSGYGAPRINGMVDGVPTNIILDGSAYANIISIHFLEKIGVEEIQTSNQQYLMADGVATRISASIFDHKQLNLLLGRETLKELKITTHYKYDHWTIKCDGKITRLPVSYENSDNEHSSVFLYEVDLTCVKNNFLTIEQLSKLQELVKKFMNQFITKEEDILLANVGKHTINTGEAKPIARAAYRLPKH